jgi:hypothetical protein
MNKVIANPVHSKALKPKKDKDLRAAPHENILRERKVF